MRHDSHVFFWFIKEITERQKCFFSNILWKYWFFSDSSWKQVNNENIKQDLRVHRSHLTTTICFFCRHVQTVTLVTMQPISDNIKMMLKISILCVIVAKCKRTLRRRQTSKSSWRAVVVFSVVVNRNVFSTLARLCSELIDWSQADNQTFSQIGQKVVNFIQFAPNAIFEKLISWYKINLWLVIFAISDLFVLHNIE